MALRVYGIQSSGPADHLAARAANVLVANDETSALLEFAVRGPKMLFHQSRTVAVTGASFAITVHEPGLDPVSHSSWSRFEVPSGATLTIKSRLKGAGGVTGYVAIAGGLDIPKYLGSASTSMVYGGVQGRSLKAGDVIPLAQQRVDGNAMEPLAVPECMVPSHVREWGIMVLAGPHTNGYFSESDCERFVRHDWEVHHNSGRSGTVSYTHLRAHETPEHLVCRLLLEKKKMQAQSATDIQ
eukprot:TRINITY_DN62847_c0_g2_i1.p1 TRINITY_DN62847_c0_g2~~TRINITY_DN62847_c0_g2_i1.p1  ORF type:complete len:241 (-),score=45.92 TRINITY_DN62847_c0_g2_i1:6-728(-)